MSISTPLRIMSFKLTEAERARLEQIAAARHVTLSEAIREGLKLYARDVFGDADAHELVT